MVTITDATGSGAVATAALTPGPLAAITLTDTGDGYTSAPTVLIGSDKEVKMVRAIRTAGYPADWPTDGRDGGVPDPTTVGPNLIQIGNEGGLMPQVAVIPNQPVNYDYNRRRHCGLECHHQSPVYGAGGAGRRHCRLLPVRREDHHSL